jgi:sodium transport system permease protein
MSAVLIWRVWFKELRESLRDRRTLLNALLIGPFLGPALFVLLTKLAVGRQQEQAEKPLPVVVIGAQYAPNMVSALKQLGLEVEPAVADPAGAVRARRIDLALRIPAAFAGQWRSGESVEIELFYDSSRQDAAQQAQRLRAMLQTYIQQTAGLRLLARGLPTTLLRPIGIAERDQATPQARGALLFAMLPYFLIMTAFMGGMFLAIDSTAGERERQSLEPLLITPISRSELLLGKLAAVACFGFASVLLSVAGFTVAAYVLAHGSMQLPVTLSSDFALRLLPLMLPLVLLVAILQMLVTSFAKTFREAQTWLGLLQLAPIIPLMIVTVLQVPAELWMFAVPLLGQEMAATELLRGEPIGWLASALCVVSTLLLASLLFVVTRKIFESERLGISA